MQFVLSSFFVFLRGRFIFTFGIYCSLGIFFKLVWNKKKKKIVVAVLRKLSGIIEFICVKNLTLLQHDWITIVQFKHINLQWIMSGKQVLQLILSSFHFAGASVALLRHQPALFNIYNDVFYVQEMWLSLNTGQPLLMFYHRFLKTILTNGAKGEPKIPS